MRSCTAQIASLVFATASGLKVGLLADLHGNPDYNSQASPDDRCVGSNSATNHLDEAPLGRYDCDGGEPLIRAMLEHYRDTFGKPDVLLVGGDHVGHVYDYWSDIKPVLAFSNDLVKEYFPDTYVLTSIGNNDTEAHDQAPSEI